MERAIVMAGLLFFLLQVQLSPLFPLFFPYSPHFLALKPVFILFIFESSSWFLCYLLLSVLFLIFFKIDFKGIHFFLYIGCSNNTHEITVLMDQLYFPCIIHRILKPWLLKKGMILPPKIILHTTVLCVYNRLRNELLEQDPANFACKEPNRI